MAAGALAGLKVLDLSRVLAGPWASQLLGDLGAEVIKVEKPGVEGKGGDDTRGWGPPWLADGDGAPTTDAAYFLCTNRNKRSLTVDMTRPEGQAILRQLAARSDVVLENFKVGGLKAYGLDYASLAAINPKLVYCSITGFGQDGPYAARAGYDFLIQGMGGLMSLTGRADGEEGAGPQKVGVALTDILTGLYAGNAILAALLHREKTGQGQHIDLALLDVQVACLANQAMNYLVSGKAPRRMGNGHPNIVPYQDFPTADSDMILAIGNDGQFARFCEIAGHGEWATDERFATNAGRVRHRADLLPLLRRATVMKTTAEWISLLENAAVPCGPINDLAGVFADPQVMHRGLRLDLPHAAGGTAPQVGNPIRFSATPVAYDRAPPRLGQDTEAVLRELGRGATEIAALRAAGVV
ncbi:MAG: CoA transferase [Sulfuritalea sp.]|nr:CoA transferase [Sulfuritalea sp.]